MKKLLFSAALLFPVFSQLAHADCLETYQEKTELLAKQSLPEDQWESAAQKSTLIGAVGGIAAGALLGSKFHHRDAGVALGAWGGLSSAFWTLPIIYKHHARSNKESLENNIQASLLVIEANSGTQSGSIATISKETSIPSETVMNIINFGSREHGGKKGDFCSGKLYSYDMIVTYVKNHRSQFEPAAAQQVVAVGSAQ